MNKPLLQIALDNLTTKEAIANVEKVKDYVDIIEVGTILISSQGVKAIEDISKKYPYKIIVADGKIADAGLIFGKMFFDNGAHYVTCICAAEIPTIATVYKLAKSYGRDKDVQIELTSYFTWAQAKQWQELGISQVVYHRSRDAQASGVNWSQSDLDKIKKLIKMGFKVTITGGVTIKDIKFFKDLPIHIFIVGRTIRDALDPQAVAKQFKETIKKYYG